MACTYNEGFPLPGACPPRIETPCHALSRCGEVAHSAAEEQEPSHDAQDVKQ
jgi:hypothetical protein